MANVQITDYSVLCYGGEDGYQTNRAQIQLTGANGKTAAWVRFNDPHMDFEQDYEDDGIVRMHLPSTMFQNVLDLVRNERPIYIDLRQGRGFLSTSKEPVGEGE